MAGSQLHELRKESGTRLPDSVVEAFTRYASSALQVSLTIENSRVVAKRTASSQAVRAAQRLKTLGAEPHDYTAKALNEALRGGADYPVLSSILSTIAGLASAGAGLLFTAQSTAFSVAKTTPRVLAREGDEIWRVEEIGVVKQGASIQPKFVLAYFLVDPLRNQSVHSKGWLVHEARYDMAL